MPYPYNNDLGKKVPNKGITYESLKSPKYWEKKLLDTLDAELAAYKKPKPIPPAFVSQTEMQKKIAAGEMLKFPGVHPLVMQNDFPGNHPANKYGKVPPFSVPDDKLDPLTKEAQAIIDQMKNGIISKQDFYSQLYGKKPALLPNPDWNKPAPQNLVEILDEYNPVMMCNTIRIKLRLDGLSIPDITFGVQQSITEQASMHMNTDMLERILDESFAKMKQEILKKVIEKAGDK